MGIIIGQSVLATSFLLDYTCAKTFGLVWPTLFNIDPHSLSCKTYGWHPERMSHVPRHIISVKINLDVMSKQDLLS